MLQEVLLLGHAVRDPDLGVDHLDNWEDMVKVIVSTAGRFHAIHLAEQLQVRGHLRKLYTTKAWYARGTIEPGKYSANLLPEIAGLAASHIPGMRNAYGYVKNNLFDLMVAARLEPCDLFVGWSGHCLRSLRKAKRFGAKIVIDHGGVHPLYPEFRSPYWKNQVQEFEEADLICIPSEFVRRVFEECGAPMEKCIVIPYGVDLELFRPIPKTPACACSHLPERERSQSGADRDDVFRVLFVGNVSMQKGIDYLWDAFLSLRLPDSELLIIGKDVECRVEYRWPNGKIKHIPYVRHEELVRYYSNASVFVLPSLMEGSAMVVYEAMACGLPCIVSENTGSVVRDGVDGFVVPIRDVEAIREKLLFFYENEEARKEMGASAKERASQFTWERYGDRIVEAYEDLR